MPTYIKVMISGPAIKTTAFNKGLGAYYYLNFNPYSDSLLYLFHEFTDFDAGTYRNLLYRGKLDNKPLRDTFLQLFESLDWRPTGVIDNIPEGALYCGWAYYVEFKDDNQIKYYVVTAGISDTLDRFFEFYTRLEHYKWDKHLANSEFLGLDEEIVAAMRNIGEYEKRETPYLFPNCKNEIDFSKLTGRWRVVGDDHNSTRKDRFHIYTINNDGTFAIQRYDSGKFERRTIGTYKANAKDRKIVYHNSVGGKMIQTVNQLTDSCFSVISTFLGTERTSEKMNFNRY